MDGVRRRRRRKGRERLVEIPIYHVRMHNGKNGRGWDAMIYRLQSILIRSWDSPHVLSTTNQTPPPTILRWNASEGVHARSPHM